MEHLKRTAPAALLVLLAILLFGTPAFAQIDLVGEWNSQFHEDQPERVGGPDVGDYSGLPINEAARAMADAWKADILSVPEHQCKPHPADYSPRGPAMMRIWKEVDTASQQVIALHTHISWQAPERTIWMDGRPHPDEFAAHTWQGFSTGTWEGQTLKVVTTHLKKGWIRRNGVPRSDQAELTEYFYRHGDFMTWTVIINDPLYLTEPMIRTSDYRTRSHSERRTLSVSDRRGNRRAARLGSALAAGREPRSRRICQSTESAGRSDAWRRRNDASGIPEESRDASTKVNVE